MRRLVTVKLPKNPDHDPHAKVTAECPVNQGQLCTDSTGEHHTVLVESNSELERLKRLHHITRIEDIA